MILLLDYDGTIVPIAEKPELARIDAETKRIIEYISENCKLAIVTGRDYKSFKNVFGDIKDTIYLITSHGVEIFRNSIKIFEERIDNPPPLEELKKEISQFEGINIEDKRGGFALHYRRFKGDVERIKRIFYEFVNKYPPRKIIEGKKVYEALYSDTNKGKGIINLFNVTGWNPLEAIYVGDDTTDFDAFKTIKRLGGKAYYVGENKPPVEIDGIFKNTEEVRLWLLKIMDECRNP